jgi:hypothetical protein
MATARNHEPEPERPEPGRNLFRECVRHRCDDIELLIDFAGAMNAGLRLDDAEVRRAAIAALHHPGAATA